MSENAQQERIGTALITGASAGIGATMAEALARRGYDLVLTARRSERLEELARRLTDDHNVRVHCLPADLAEPAAARHLVEELKSRQIRVDLLVNNAGYGIPGAYLSVDWPEHEAFLQVMVGAVAELSWRLAGPMVERGHGRIINIASLAGLVPPSAGHTLYGAVKALMVRFSQSLAQELKPKGVTVTAVCPGFTYTEFHDVNNMRARVSQMPDYLWMDADEVVRQALEAAEAGREVVVTGRVNRIVATLAKILPTAWFRALMNRRSKQFRKAD